MKIFLKVISAFLFLAVAFGSFAEETTTASSYRFRPCPSWTTNVGGRGYLCNFPDTNAEVPTYQNYVQTIQKLELRIKALEEEVQVLKSQN